MSAPRVHNRVLIPVDAVLSGASSSHRCKYAISPEVLSRRPAPPGQGL